MIHPETHVVTEDNGPRPAGEPDRCLYCAAALGSDHGGECVCRKRTVVVRATIEYVVSVPESWDAHQIEFHRNDGSWCAGNMLAELTAIDEVPERCLCPLVSYEYVREAEEADEVSCFGGPGLMAAPGLDAGEEPQ